MSTEDKPNTNQTIDFFDAYRKRLGHQLIDQVGRIEAARERMLASSQALSAGVFASAPDGRADSAAAQRVESMGNSIDRVLGKMQQQAERDIDSVMEQHRGMRHFQHEMARQKLAGQAKEHPVAAQDIVDAEVVIKSDELPALRHPHSTERPDSE